MPRPPRHAHDLLAILASERAALGSLAANADPFIRWSRARRDARSVVMASYDGSVIRVHPALDHREVPGYVVGHVVRHELLHAIVGVQNGRHHSPAFKLLEMADERYIACEAWAQKEWRRAVERWAGRE